MSNKREEYLAAMKALEDAGFKIHSEEFKTYEMDKKVRLSVVMTHEVTEESDMQMTTLSDLFAQDK